MPCEPAITFEAVHDGFKNSWSEEKVYGTDVEHTLFTKDYDDIWKIQNMIGVLYMVENKIKSICTPFSYLGSTNSVFGWHTEDLNAGGVSYLASGKPKTWSVYIHIYK